MTATDTFARPSYRTVNVAEEEEEEDCEKNDPIASIRALSIDIGDHDDISNTPNQHNNASTSIATNSSSIDAAKTTSTPPSQQLQPPSSKASSLRSLLGVPASSTGTSLSSGSGMLGVPPSTSSLTAPAGIGGASGARLGGYGVKSIPSEIAPKRRKVILGPGCSPLDWARLKSTIPSRGFRKIKPSELKSHNTKQDAWSAFNGKVYDMTPYLRFHPGGEDELMRVAGRDGTRLFMLTHSWVNIDSMIDSCVVGVLVSESST